MKYPAIQKYMQGNFQWIVRVPFENETWIARIEAWQTIIAQGDPQPSIDDALASLDRKIQEEIRKLQEELPE